MSGNPYRWGKTAPERFWARVVKSDGCWEWTGVITNTGYGVIYSGPGQRWTTHRYSWTLAYGPIPDGLWVLHRCDNKPCVRPDHLFLGDARSNVHDMDAKGRRVVVGSPGERNVFARLTWAQVSEIRARAAAGANRHDLAAEYRVNYHHLRKILRGAAWNPASQPSDAEELGGRGL